MLGKKVQVFWPVDDSWYTGTVFEYDPTNGEHLLRYEDGDSEWVRIGSEQTGMPPEGAPPQPPETPHLETPQATPDRHGAVLPPPRSSGGGGMAYYPHPTAYGGPGSNVPGVVYTMYPPNGGGGPMDYATPPPGPPRGPQSPQQQQGPGGVSVYRDPPPPYPGALPELAHGAAYGAESPSKRKSGPKAWTKDEDVTLLRMFQQMQMPMKWSVVALSLPGRTGKQCRERYVNHLNPRLKVSEWNPIEDATIFHLYGTTGSHWSSMSKVIPGRTDNGIKNRFHNLRRQVEREDEARSKKNVKTKDCANFIRLNLLRDFPADLQGKFDTLWKKEEHLAVLAAETMQASELDAKSYFGPMEEARDGQACVRCGFVMPSVQTGRQVCSKSGWCLACCLLPPQLSGNLLRECLALRREGDAALETTMEAWSVPEQRQDATA
jgi:hypothetical protein